MTDEQVHVVQSIFIWSSAIEMTLHQGQGERLAHLMVNSKNEFIDLDFQASDIFSFLSKIAF